MSNIEVNFEQYLPSITTIAQYNLIFLEKGFIDSLELVQQKDQTFRLHVIRKEKPFGGIIDETGL